MAISSYKRGIAMRQPKPVHQMTSAQFDAMFPDGDEDACIRYLIARRWPKGVICPAAETTRSMRSLPVITGSANNVL